MVTDKNNNEEESRNESSQIYNMRNDDASELDEYKFSPLHSRRKNIHGHNSKNNNNGNLLTKSNPRGEITSTTAATTTSSGSSFVDPSASSSPRHSLSRLFSPLSRAAVEGEKQEEEETKQLIAPRTPTNYHHHKIDTQMLMKMESEIRSPPNSCMARLGDFKPAFWNNNSVIENSSFSSNSNKNGKDDKTNNLEAISLLRQVSFGEHSFSTDASDDEDVMEHIRQEEEADLHAPEKLLMDAVDRIEDETDPHDRLPLKLRLFLENYVFGWSHVTADILAHTLYPLASYIIVYFLLSWAIVKIGDIGYFLGLRKKCYLLGGEDNNNITKTYSSDYESGSIKSTVRDSCAEEWRVFLDQFDVELKFIMHVLGFVSAVSTYRSIRRRRGVWLKHKYDKIDVQEVDRTTLLGRIRRGVSRRRNRMLANRVQKKLLKATNRFHKKLTHDNEREILTTTSTNNNIIHQRNRPRDILKETLSGFTVVRKEGLSGIIHQTIQNLSPDVELMTGLSKDQIFLSELIHNIPYAHGGYFGAAPFMLGDPVWIDILRSLMPDVYVEVARRVFSPVPKLIHWAENNPVCAAYGTTQDLELQKAILNISNDRSIKESSVEEESLTPQKQEQRRRPKVTTIEWDVFLDPLLVGRLELVIQERDNILRRLNWEYYSPFQDKASHWLHERERQNHLKMRANNITTNNINKEYQTEAERNITMNSYSMSDELSKEEVFQTLYINVLKHHDIEIKRRTEQLIEKMLIAHGNTTHLMLEQTGYMKRYIFSRLKRTCKTLGGGIFARHWLSVYAAALKMGVESSNAGNDLQDSDDSSSTCSSSSSSSTSSESKYYDGSSRIENDDSLGSSPLSSNEMELIPLHQQQKRTATMRRSLSYKRRSKKLSKRRTDPTSIDYESDNGKSRKVSNKNYSSSMMMYQETQESKDHHSSTYLRDEGRESTSLGALALTSFQDTTIPESIGIINSILSDYDELTETEQSNQNHPQLSLILDLKSRHVSKKVWACVVDSLRNFGVHVKGIGSFFANDIRTISQYTINPVGECYFFHSAGDVQHACHSGDLKFGDVIYFNAGSLLWPYSHFLSNISSASECCSVFKERYLDRFKRDNAKSGYALQPYADTSENEGDIGTTISTLKSYQRRLGLRIGLYCQEFAVDDAALDILVRYTNRNADTYQMGFCWGGVNGVTVRGINPGRFTHTDGFWNQRYLGKTWDYSLRACDIGCEDNDSSPTYFQQNSIEVAKLNSRPNVVRQSSSITCGDMIPVY